MHYKIENLQKLEEYYHKVLVVKETGGYCQYDGQGVCDEFRGRTAIAFINKIMRREKDCISSIGEVFGYIIHV